jgi:hypothetical protein
MDLIRGSLIGSAVTLQEFEDVLHLEFMRVSDSAFDDPHPCYVVLHAFHHQAPFFCGMPFGIGQFMALHAGFTVGPARDRGFEFRVLARIYRFLPVFA